MCPSEASGPSAQRSCCWSWSPSTSVQGRSSRGPVSPSLLPLPLRLPGAGRGQSFGQPPHQRHSAALHHTPACLSGNTKASLKGAQPPSQAIWAASQAPSGARAPLLPALTQQPAPQQDSLPHWSHLPPPPANSTPQRPCWRQHHKRKSYSPCSEEGTRGARQN